MIQNKIILCMMLLCVITFSATAINYTPPDPISKDQMFSQVEVIGYLNYTNCTLTINTVNNQYYTMIFDGNFDAYIYNLSNGPNTLTVYCIDQALTNDTETWTVTKYSTEDNMLYWIGFLLVLISPFFFMGFNMLTEVSKKNINPFIYTSFAIFAMVLIYFGITQFNFFYNEILYIMAIVFYGACITLGVVKIFIWAVNLFNGTRGGINE